VGEAVLVIKRPPKKQRKVHSNQGDSGGITLCLCGVERGGPRHAGGKNTVGKESYRKNSRRKDEAYWLDA